MKVINRLTILFSFILKNFIFSCSTIYFTILIIFLPFRLFPKILHTVMEDNKTTYGCLYLCLEPG